MRLLDYTKEETLERLLYTIDAILSYKRNLFQTKRLVNIIKGIKYGQTSVEMSEKMKHGQSFKPHLRHLEESGFLSKTKGSRNLYEVKDRDGLIAYRHLILFLLFPSPANEKELKKIKQI